MGWRINSLRPNYYVWRRNVTLPVTLTDGPHTLKLYADATGVIRESKESNNRYYLDFETTAEAYPPTEITSKNSSSSYATSENPFYRDGYAGQCTWYAYARVIELVGGGHLPSAAANRMWDAFRVAGGRNANQWPNKLGGNWFPREHAGHATDAGKR